MARRINILKAPFDYRWPGRTAITAFTATGVFLVKDEVAEYAIAKGYAIEVPEAPARKTRRRKSATTRRNATAADTRPANRVVDADVHADDRPADGRPVDQPSG